MLFHVLSTVWEPQSDPMVSPGSMSTENSVCLLDEFYFPWDQELSSCRKFQGCWGKMKHYFAPVSEYCDNNSIRVGLYIYWLSQYDSSNVILQVLVQRIISQVTKIIFLLDCSTQIFLSLKQVNSSWCWWKMFKSIYIIIMNKPSHILIGKICPLGRNNICSTMWMVVLLNEL